MNVRTVTRPHYKFKRKPLGRQLEVIEDHWADAQHALLCRPGTGKSKMIIDHAGMQYMAGMIEALVILAPNGVHLQWVLEAIPNHLSEQVPWSGGAFSSRDGVLARRALDKKLESKDMALKVLSISFDALQTPNGKKLVNRILSAYRCMVAVDESHRVSNPKTHGYKAARAACRSGYTRRIATGTLIRQNPFSAYGQFELMGEGMLGFGSLASFKSMFAEMLPNDHYLVQKIANDFAAKTGKIIAPQIMAKDDDNRPIYKNLPYLRKQLERHSSFMTLKDVNGEEPVVFHSTRYVELTHAQRALYDDLIEIGVADAPNGQLTVEGSLALATRLSQVVGGFCPSDDDPLAAPVGADNPKMLELLDCIDELGQDEKVIIWCKFKPELMLVARTLAHLYGENAVCEYHGDVKPKDRAKSKADFLAGTRFLVAHQKAAGTGLDGLQAVCSYMIFYSNDYPYLEREQAEARLARTGKEGATNVIDIMAVETIDSDIVKCMQGAQDVTERVLYPALTRKWI